MILDISFLAFCEVTVLVVPPILVLVLEDGVPGSMLGRGKINTHTPGTLQKRRYYQVPVLVVVQVLVARSQQRRYHRSFKILVRLVLQQKQFCLSPPYLSEASHEKFGKNW
jgi:hypothetical protein